MKEMGEYLKEKRRECGVGLEEAADDLNLTKYDIENIEAGNIRAFRDVLKLKKMVGDYAKYLGLDAEKITDEFNDFLFEHTSRISLEDILEAKEKREEEEKKIKSPYTKDRKKHFNIEKLLELKPLIIVVVIILVLLLIIFISIRVVSNNDEKVRNSELMRGECLEYEFT